MVSFLTSQTTSGPRKLRPISAPTMADRWANIAHWRSSAFGEPLGGGGGVMYSFGSDIVFSP